MDFRYKDAQGKVVHLPDLPSLAQAIRDGVLTAETPLASGAEREFKRAGLVVAYQQASVALGFNRLGTTPTAPGLVARVGEQPRSWKLYLGLALIPLAIGGFLLLRAGGSGKNASTPEVALPPPSSAPEVAAARDSLTTIFADSFAVAVRRLEEWAAAQKFEQRFRGGALQSAASLKAARSGTKAYAAQVDSLVRAASAIRDPLAARADSLESSGRPLAGLLAATQDALEAWQKEVAAYGDLERNVATAIDAIAEFLQSRQQSFVVREGLPVFLSRDDGLRFRDLKQARDDSEGAVARWAGGLLERNPQWMSALDPARRPAFHRRTP